MRSHSSVARFTDRMKLLVDHNLPARLAVALDTIFQPDHQIVALKDKFGRSNLTDEDWITELGREGGWAVLHRDIIRRFGRFPHRNRALGRETTPEEQAFLDQDGFRG